MVYDEMTFDEVMKECASVLRPEMQKAFWEGMAHYLIQTEAEAKTSSEDDYFKFLSKVGWKNPKLHQNYWKLYIAQAAEIWEAGMCLCTLEECKESALKQQEYLDWLTEQGVDLNDEAD